MTTTSKYPLKVRGVRLDTLAHNIEIRDGLTMMPAIRGASEVIPGKHGSLYVPGKRRTDGRILLDMWADGVDVDGKLTSLDGYQQWRANMDKLYMLFDTSLSQALIEEEISPTNIRQAYVECIPGIDPRLTGRWFGKFSVDCKINDSFWQSSQEYTWQSPVGVAALGTHTLATFAPSTAPMEDLVLTIRGAITNPRIIDVSTGHYIQFSGTVTSPVDLVINTTHFTYVMGGASQTSKIITVGVHSPRAFAISPNSAGPQVRLEGTGTDANTRLTIVGRRKFL